MILNAIIERLKRQSKDDFKAVLCSKYHHMAKGTESILVAH
jgi:hypothetical protein